MKTLRIFLAIIFVFLIIIGLWKYYSLHDEVQISNFFKNLSTKDNFTTVEVVAQKKDITGKLVHFIKNNKNILGGVELHEDFSEGMISTEQEKRLLDLGVKGGNESGNVVWIHYCDYDTKYCKKSYDEGIVYEYQKMLPDLGYIYKPFPPTTRRLDMLPHRAVLCAMKNGTRKQAQAYYYALYQKPTMRESVEDLDKLGKGFNITGIEDCLKKNDYDLLIQQEIKFAKKLFGIKALPANIFLNKKTKKWILVPGYYEKEEIQKVIEYIK